MYNCKYKLSAYCIFIKHKNEHNRQKIGEMPKSIMSKFWSIIDSSLVGGGKSLIKEEIRHKE